MAERSDVFEGQNYNKSSERERFPTAPGGGRNRISAGRHSASVYVSPATLPEVAHCQECTGPFHLDNQLISDVARVGTEPGFFSAQGRSMAVDEQQREFSIHQFAWSFVCSSLSSCSCSCS